MEINDLKNRQINSIKLQDNEYKVELSLKTNVLLGFDECFFTLEMRTKEYPIYVSSVVKNTQGEYTIFSLSYSPEFNNKTLLDDEVLDLYVNFRKNDEIKKSRIKSTQDNLRILSTVFPDEKKIFYPYTTKNGNISFRLNDYKLFADFETIKIEGLGVIFSGYFIYAPMFNDNSYKIIKKELVIRTNVNDEEIVVPLEDETRVDIYNNYNGNSLLKESGFKGNFKIKHGNITEETTYYKFYFKLTYEKNNHIKVMESTRMRWVSNNKTGNSKIQKNEDKKIKILVKPTRKSSFLSVQVSEYNLKNDLLQRTKRNWVKLRRSDKLKELYKIVFYTFGQILPVKKNLIVFESFLGKQYSDSPKAIYEYMMKNNQNYEMFWSVDREYLSVFKDANVKHVRRFSVKWLLLMTRAKYWVSNSRLPLWIPKPRGTIYLQTWHGTPLKRLATDMEEVHMPGTNTVKYKNNFLKEANKWDYLVSPNAYSTEIFKRAFQFDRTMIESGYPRNDFLINHNNQETISQIKKENRLPTDKKIILYAPTWRDNQFYGKGKYKFDLEFDLEKLRTALGEEYIIVLRLHYLVAENLDLSGYEDFIFDYSYHEDIRDLYLISDLLITDYSSVFFDYANLKRPMLFYVYDIDDYRDNLRGFYFDFELKAPGPLVRTTEEIITEIKKIDEFGFEPSKKTKIFYEKFCYLEDGRASERVVKTIFKD